jgi:hypothetical protein
MIVPANVPPARITVHFRLTLAAWNHLEHCDLTKFCVNGRFIGLLCILELLDAGFPPAVAACVTDEILEALNAESDAQALTPTTARKGEAAVSYAVLLSLILLVAAVGGAFLGVTVLNVFGQLGLNFNDANTNPFGVPTDGTVPGLPYSSYAGAPYPYNQPPGSEPAFNATGYAAQLYGQWYAATADTPGAVQGNWLYPGLSADENPSFSPF